MKSYSFLEESQNQFFKRLSRYTPEEQKRIVDKLFQIGKQNGGFHDRNYLASKIYDGQLKRIGNLAKKNGRKVGIAKSNYLQGNTALNRLISDNMIRDNWRFHKPKTTRLATSGKDIIILPSKKIKNIAPIYKSDIASHEADEYSEILKWAKKYKISPEEAFLKSAEQAPGISHQVGNVLTREQKRNKRLKLLFPDFVPKDRSVPEFRDATQKLSKRPLSKEYQDLLNSSLKIHRFYNQ